MAQTKLDAITQLSRFQSRLNNLGYQTLEQFLGAAHASPYAMKGCLETDTDDLLTSLPAQYQPAVAAARAYASAPRKFGLGAALSRKPGPQPRFDAFLAAPVLPPKFDLIAQMPPIEDQGQRGTCVAFASLATVEHYAGLQGAYKNMSEQFLYWDCKAWDGESGSDYTWLEVSFARLQDDGCCLAATWPYNANPTPGNLGQGPPTAGARADAAAYTIAQYNPLAAKSVPDLKAELVRGRAIAFIIPIFNSWYQNSGVTQSGDITMPLPGEPDQGGHAMCLVGYKDNAGDPGGGRFIVRNSWGPWWGTKSPYGAGYGTIPYDYLTKLGDTAYSIY